MASRPHVLAEAKQALDAFLMSRAHFRVVHTVPSSTTTTMHSQERSVGAAAAAGSASATAATAAARAAARTLLILDSSFNPPSVAHLSLAVSALKAAARQGHQEQLQQPFPAPHRLLLLFSVHNADKSPAPASFEQRLAMMMVLAQDIQQHVAQAPEEVALADIDVGLTTKPYYNDKTTAIEEDGPYSDRPRHIHLVGYDTFVRIFEPKYYANHNPPLSALAGYFEKHGFRITLRPEAKWGGTTEQAGFRRRLQQGHMEAQGGKREWAEQIDVVESESQGIGVSSTQVRQAIERKDWATVSAMCPAGIAEWLQEMAPYGKSEENTTPDIRL